MKVTQISAQQKNPNRVNISVDGKYRLSLDLYQVSDLGITVGKELTEHELVDLENESDYGKLYARALEYSLVRPRSAKEIRDYLWKKTRSRRYRSRSGEIKEAKGLSQQIADRVYERLEQKGYIDDERFSKYWVEYRNVKKGSSRRKLISELRTKGVDQNIINNVMALDVRNDESEIDKVIAKKQGRYDNNRLTQYLMRQGFSYDLIRSKLTAESPFRERETD